MEIIKTQRVLVHAILPRPSSIHHPKCQHESVASPLDRQPDSHRNIHRSEMSMSLRNRALVVKLMWSKCIWDDQNRNTPAAVEYGGL